MQPNPPASPSSPADVPTTTPAPAPDAGPGAPDAAAQSPTPVPATDPASTSSASVSGRFTGPDVGEVVGYTTVDPYADDTEVTRYGVVVAQHPADPKADGAVDQVELAWLPAGTALIAVADLDEL